MRRTFLLGLFLLAAASRVQAETTRFTYQGALQDAGAPASGSFDLQFGLFDALTNGTQIGTTQTLSAVTVTQGVLTATLDFGVSAFPGADRFLEIAVRPTGGGGSFTTLAPRQQISASPYAIRTLSAATADALSSACVGCVQDTQIQGVAGSKVTGTIPAASLPANSGSYVQNTTSPQAGANFNIGGNGVVGGTLTVNGALHATFANGAVIQNRTTKQTAASFDIDGNGTARQLAAANVGAATTTPHTPLEVNGTGWSTGDSTPLVPAAGKGLGMGVATRGAFSGDGYLFAYDYASAKPASLVLNDPGGSVIVPNSVVGIGTTSPTNGALDVETTAVGVTAINAKSQTGTAIAGQSGTVLGGFGNGIGIGVQGASTTSYGVTGATNAAHTSTIAAVQGVSMGQGGVGVIGQADQAGGSWGVFGTSASALGVGVYGHETSGGWAMQAQGDTQQTRTAGGWIKAMVDVDESGNIIHCFNSFLSGAAAGTPPCGASVTVMNTPTGVGGDYLVDFGFQVNDRFFSLSAHEIRSDVLSIDLDNFNVTEPSQVLVSSIDPAHLVNDPQEFLGTAFTLVVY